jgi:hypothetical protein
MQYGSRTIVMLGVFLAGLFPWGTALSTEGVSLLDAKRAKIQSMHVEAVRDFLYLAPHEEQPFWSLYEEYRADTARMNDNLVRLLKHYASNSDNLTDQQARDLLDEFLQVKEAKVQLQYLYVARFRQILPGRSVARLFQLEQKLDAAIEADLADVVPLVK